MKTTENLFSVVQGSLPAGLSAKLSSQYLLVTDRVVGEDLYDGTVIYSSPTLDLGVLDKVLIESLFPAYTEWTDEHCQRPEVPASEALPWYPGTFGDSKHLKYSDHDYPVSHTIKGLLAGTDKIFIEEGPNPMSREDPWAYRLRVFNPGDKLPVFPADTTLVELP